MIHDTFSDFYTKLDGSVNRHAPFKELFPKEIKIKNKPWLPEKSDNLTMRRLYTILRNRVNREIKKSKKQYYAEYFASNVNNTKKTWEGIRKIVNIKMSSKPSQLNINGKIIDDDKKLATNFNNFFVNVGQNTENAIPKAPNISPSKFLKKSYSNKLYYSSYC